MNPDYIVLTKDELELCIEFSRRSAPTQQDIEFGQHDTQARTVGEVGRDTLIGKIAEVAFAKILKENYSVHIDLDFEIYERTKYDEQDAFINDWRIDVKGTRQGGHYLLVEWNKLNFRQVENRLSHVYTMFSVGWDRGKDAPNGIVKYAGAATLRAMSSDANWSNTLVLHKGDCIPGTKMRLQADNYGIEFSDLNKNLDGLIRVMKSRKPDKIVEENFKNPYTGETTLEIIESEESIRNHQEAVIAYLKQLSKLPRK